MQVQFFDDDSMKTRIPPVFTLGADKKNYTQNDVMMTSAFKILLYVIEFSFARLIMNDLMIVSRRE